MESAIITCALFIYVVMVTNLVSSQPTTNDQIVCNEQPTHMMMEFQATLNTLQNEVMAIKSELAIERNKTGTLQHLMAKEAKIAFTATGYGSEWTKYDQFAQVLFPNVISNKGQHYNGTISKFTCPLTGHYFFTFNVYSRMYKYGEERDGTDIVLMYDNRWQVQAQCETHTNEVIELQCSQSTVTYCETGKMVWIETHGWGANIWDGSVTTFSGFLLFSE